MTRRNTDNEIILIVCQDEEWQSWEMRPGNYYPSGFFHTLLLECEKDNMQTPQPHI